ncbi:MAG: hypothetical protein ACYTEU_06095, partial [Planctomycetota bacterium]
MKKTSWMAILILAGMICVPSAVAIPDTIVTSEFKLPADENIKVTVASTVTELGPSDFLYTYQVRGIGDLNIISLSVPFFTPLTKPAEIDEFSAPDAATIYWGTIGDPAVTA